MKIIVGADAPPTAQDDDDDDGDEDDDAVLSRRKAFIRRGDVIAPPDCVYSGNTTRSATSAVLDKLTGRGGSEKLTFGASRSVSRYR